MGTASGMMGRWAVATAALLIVGASRAPADITTERSASILIFPKILVDTTGGVDTAFVQTGGVPVDTIIQISNTSNSMVFAHCYYVNAVPLDPTRPPSAVNLLQWQEVDFEIALTRQQPTHWLVSSGRGNDLTDNKPCAVDCSNAGFDPGLASLSAVPPVTDPFTGELKCIEVDSSGAPINGNHLKGEATIVTKDGKADASKYNAIGVLGLNTDTNNNNSDNTLCLGGDIRQGCPNGAEYNACPQTVILNHFAENATDPVIESLGNGNGQSKVSTELTLVPCTEDFETQSPVSVTVQFLLINEFEELFSTSTTVTCWGNFRLSKVGNLGKVFDVGTVGTRFVQTRMVAAGDEQPGFMGVAEEFHQQPISPAPATVTSRAAVNLHGEGARRNGDVVTLLGSF